MRRLMWVMVGVLISMMLLAVIVHAAPYYEEEGVRALKDGEFQSSVIFERCKEAGGTRDEIQECAFDETLAYTVFIETVHTAVYMEDQDKSLQYGRCVMETLHRFWDSETNTLLPAAKWDTAVRDCFKCMDKIEE